MFRIFLRSIAINLASIYIVVQVLSETITYVGGFKTLLMAALAISVINLLIRPIINLLLLPINLITTGLFRWVANLVTLYLVTWLIPNLQIHAFSFPGANLQYIIIPAITFSAFGSFILVTLILTVVFHALYWLFQD